MLIKKKRKNVTRVTTFVILLLVCLYPVQAAARQLNSIDLIERAYRNGEIRRSEALNYKVNAILRPESVPAVYRSKGIIKSATTVLMEARLNRHLLSSENSRILAMGRAATLTELYKGVTLQSHSSPQGRFRIHSTTDNTNGDAVPSSDLDANGVPDYVERFAEILDNVWTTEIGVMGYDAPPSDGTEVGDCLLDVYLADLNAYGYTQIDENDPVSMVYMIFENDFTIDFPPNTDRDGYAAGAMKVVAAHEFFHTIQFQITEDICTNGWWMEASSTWMEDYIYPDVNDYINYIDYWFQRPDLPLNTYDCAGNTHILFPYGTTIWVKHMTEKYGSEFVYDVWTKIKAGPPAVTALSAVTEALTDRGTTLEQELKELRVANVTMTYEDAYWYQNWQLVNNAPNIGPIEVTYSADNPDFSSSVTYNSVPLLPLSAEYYSFSAPQGSGNLSINFNKSGNVGLMVIGFNANHTAYDVTEILTDSNNAGSITINGFGSGGPYSRVVVIPINYSDISTGSFNLTASYTTTPSGYVSCVNIKPATTSLVTGDTGISAKQQYYLIIMDDSNRQVLHDGVTWEDNSPDINIDGNGLATAANVATCATITASLQTYITISKLSAVSHGTTPSGSPIACTVTNDMVCALTNSITISDSRCFIATAAFGSPLNPYVGLLREFRDIYLLSNTPGRWIVSLYYSSSPPIAEIVSDNPWLKAMVKIFLIPAIIISWAMVKLTLGEKIIIALLLVVVLSIITYIIRNRLSRSYPDTF